MLAVTTTPAPSRDQVIASALAGIRDGKSFQQLSEELGCPRATINHWLLSSVPDEYRELQQLGLVARIVDADEMLDGASSHLDVARARERCRFTRWDAERRLPHMFAQRTEITGPGGGPIELTDFDRAKRFVFLRSHLEQANVIDVDPVTQRSTDEPAA